jgi:aminoglycoside phosphotransferase family enzyme/predicted kinase
LLLNGQTPPAPSSIVTDALFFLIVLFLRPGQGDVSHLAELIAQLSRPEAFGPGVSKVEVHQTHISVVFLAGESAWKVKKPVRFDFLDFSTLERRRHFCAEEVRLNRRHAPDVYLGVVPITRRASPGLAAGELRIGGEGEVVEWAVHMRRLPADATLLQKLKRGEVERELIERVAQRVADFHRRAESTDAMKAAGRFDAVAASVRKVVATAGAQFGTTISRGVFARLEHRLDETLDRLRPLIDFRAECGLTRDTHGDLHLDHVYHFPDRPPPGDLVLVDCIEFNERFRQTDPVADMAFLVMDLTFHGRRDLAASFADAYFRAANDDEGRALLPLYTAYRAGVRGMVDGLTLAEPEVDETERRRCLERARGHWLLALGELEPPTARPCLVLVAGLPGTGKSTLARHLADRADFRVLRSDVVRKELAGLPPGQPAPDRAALYAPGWSERTYAELVRQADEILLDGGRALVDANFRQEGQRQLFLDLARRRGVPVQMLRCTASIEVVRQRLAGRRGDASDAGWSEYQKLASEWEPAGESTRRHLTEIATDGSDETTAARALEELRAAAMA